MQRVDLGDDGLRPEGVGARQQQSGDESGRQRSGQFGADQDDEADGRCGGDGRTEIGGAGGFEGQDADEQARDGVVKGVALSGVEHVIPGDLLKRRGVAQVLSGEQRGGVEEERDGRHYAGRHEARAQGVHVGSCCVRPSRAPA